MTSNQYFNSQKVRNSLQGGSGISYDSTTGTISAMNATSNFIPYTVYTLNNNDLRAQWVEIGLNTSMPGLQLNQSQILPASAEAVVIKVPLFTVFNSSSSSMASSNVTVNFIYRVNATNLTAAPSVVVNQDAFSPLGAGAFTLSTTQVTSASSGNVATQTPVNAYQNFQITFATPAIPAGATYRYSMNVTLNDASTPTSQPSIFGTIVQRV